mmetsp:Transcript_3068/g.5414  ORF Transcript_3068/g.5414 Transcript_3068/m.5414 type:complete len:245 (-) Transcript_3068:1116-1850(-)
MWWGDLLLKEAAAGPVVLQNDSSESEHQKIHKDRVHSVWPDLSNGHYESGVLALSTLLSGPDLPLLTGPWHISEQLVLGNVFHAKDLRAMRRMQITHVLNLAPDGVKTDRAFYAFPQTLVQEYLSLPATDSESFDLFGKVAPEALDFLERAHHEKSNEVQYSHPVPRNDPILSSSPRPGNRVLVNCLAGMNRSVSVIIAFLMQHHGMHLLEAVQLVWRRRGSRILTNRGFRNQLVTFALRLDTG